MTVAEMSKVIGLAGLYHVGGLAFPVRVDDVRERFGRVDYLIVPLGGEGSRWVASESVSA